MSVYVDTMRAPYRGMVMCHMLADSTDELLAMADAIGVDRIWIQSAGTHREHFDISLTMRAKAVKRGAIVLNMREVAELLNRRRAAALPVPSTPPEGR